MSEFDYRDGIFRADEYDVVDAITAYRTCRDFHRHEQVRLDLGWDSAQPYLVDVKISIPGIAPGGVTWGVGRDLLWQGFVEGKIVGHGEVKISPNPAAGSAVRLPWNPAGTTLSQYGILKFRNPSGRLRISISRIYVQKFLWETFQKCPREVENKLVRRGVDDVIAQLLG